MDCLLCCLFFISFSDFKSLSFWLTDCLSESSEKFFLLGSWLVCSLIYFSSYVSSFIKFFPFFPRKQILWNYLFSLSMNSLLLFASKLIWIFNVNAKKTDWDLRWKWNHVNFVGLKGKSSGMYIDRSLYLMKNNVF